jgi:hypothetical protein
MNPKDWAVLLRTVIVGQIFCVIVLLWVGVL